MNETPLTWVMVLPILMLCCVPLIWIWYSDESRTYNSPKRKAEREKLRRQESQRLKRANQKWLKRRKEKEEQIREQEDLAWKQHVAMKVAREKSAIARQKTIEDSIAGKINYRLSPMELLGVLESDTGEDLELVALGILRSKGWEVELTGRGADGGIDIEGQIERPNGIFTLAVQVKHWKSSVTEVQVRDFWGACSGVYDEGLFVTSSKFNRNAKKFIADRKDLGGTHLKCWELPQLCEEIESMSRDDFDAMLRPLKAKLLSRIQ